MALQFVGIGLVVAAIYDFFKGIVKFFVEHATRRVLVIAAVLAALATLVIGFMRTISGIVNQLQMTMPVEVSQYIGLVIPSNFNFCVSLYASAMVIRWAYEWNVKVLQWRL